MYDDGNNVYSSQQRYANYVMLWLFVLPNSLFRVVVYNSVNQRPATTVVIFQDFFFQNTSTKTKFLKLAHCQVLFTIVFQAKLPLPRTLQDYILNFEPWKSNHESEIALL